MSITVKELHDEVLSALEQFGTYSFSDKGAHEVMHIAPLVSKLKELTAPEAASVLRSLCHSGPVSKQRFMVLAAYDIVGDLQEWGALFEQPGMEDLLGGDDPDLIGGDVPHRSTKK